MPLAFSGCLYTRQIACRLQADVLYYFAVACWILPTLFHSEAPVEWLFQLIFFARAQQHQNCCVSFLLGFLFVCFVFFSFGVVVVVFLYTSRARFSRVLCAVSRMRRIVGCWMEIDPWTSLRLVQICGCIWFKLEHLCVVLKGCLSFELEYRSSSCE